MNATNNQASGEAYPSPVKPPGENLALVHTLIAALGDPKYMTQKSCT